MTSWRNRLRRPVHLLHRWTGVAACILMAVWFVSGMVMLFVGYPKLTPWERTAALPRLDARCCMPLSDAMRAAGLAPARMREATLTTVAGRAVYRLLDAEGRHRLLDARTGQPLSHIDTNHVLASARAFVPQAEAHYLGTVDEDRWTHSRALNPHRPLHRVQMDDADNTLLYLSSATGEVVLDAPQAQRRWNVVGAWLHWLYLFRNQPSDPVWSWLVIALSAVATVTAISGTVVGIWRWRFAGRYKSGSHSPYREPLLRWHHMLGLTFAAIVSTWIFSGLMSMNPLGIFDAKGERPNLNAWRGAAGVDADRAPQTAQALALLAEQGFDAVELAWKMLGGQPYLLARNAANDTRLVMQEIDGRSAVRTAWDETALRLAGQRLLTAPLSSVTRLSAYDAYYYARQPEAMSGAAERRLPALRLVFGDAHRTWVHVDCSTGDIVSSLDRSQRVGRWLFNFLHSWDLPAMLRAGWRREAVLISLGLGGLALSLTGVVLGYGRVRKWARAPRR